jgi:hypothetical protein
MQSSRRKQSTGAARVASLAKISGTINKPDAWLRVEQKKVSEMGHLDMFSGFVDLDDG